MWAARILIVGGVTLLFAVPGFIGIWIAVCPKRQNSGAFTRCSIVNQIAFEFVFRIDCRCELVTTKVMFAAFDQLLSARWTAPSGV